MLKFKDNLLLIIGLFSGFVQASELSERLLEVASQEVEYVMRAQILIGLGADVNYSDIDGNTPLIKASENGHKNIVELLLSQANIVIDQPDTKGWTPLMFASQKGHVDIVRMLVEARAHVNQANTDTGATPLMIASLNGHTAVVQMLLGAGAHVNQATTDDGATPLMWASLTGHADIVQLLLAAGAHVNQATTNDRWTALMFASLNGHRAVVRLLLDADANLNQATIDGRKALDIALGNGHPATVEILEEKIAQDARWQDLRSAWCGIVHKASSRYLDHNAADVAHNVGPDYKRLRNK